jgi:hypothetical protein
MAILLTKGIQTKNFKVDLIWPDGPFKTHPAADTFWLLAELQEGNEIVIVHPSSSDLAQLPASCTHR